MKRLLLLSLLPFVVSLAAMAQSNELRVAWWLIENTYQQMSPKDQAFLRMRLNIEPKDDRYTNEGHAFEGYHHYVRAAMTERQLVNDMANAFEADVCDTLFTYFKKGLIRSVKTDTTDIRYLVYYAMRHVFLDHSSMYDRLKWSIDQQTANRYAGNYKKQFNALDAQLLLDAHTYPQRYAYLAEKDKVLANVLIRPYEQESIQLAEALLTEKACTIGKHHPCYALTLSDLAMACIHTQNNDGQYAALVDRAIALQTEAIAIYRKAKMPFAEKLSVQFLSHLYFRKSGHGNSWFDNVTQLDEAIAVKRRELAAIQPVLGDDAVEVIAAKSELNNLINNFTERAAKWHERGNDEAFSKAMKFYRQDCFAEALLQFHQLTESEHFTYLRYRAKYAKQWEAACHRQLGDTTKAAELDPYYKLAPVDRTKTLEIDYQLEKESNYQLCIDMVHDSIGVGTPECARLLLHLYEYIYARGQYALSVSMLSEVKSVCHRLMGKEDPIYTDILIKLGDVYRNMEYYQEAILAYEEAVAMTAKNHNRNNEKYQELLTNLVWVCKNANDVQRLCRWTQVCLEECPEIPVDNRFELMADCARMVLNADIQSTSDTTMACSAVDYVRQVARWHWLKADTLSLKEIVQKALSNEIPSGIKNDPLQRRSEALKNLGLLAKGYKLLKRTDELKRLETNMAAWMRDSSDWRLDYSWTIASRRGLSNYNVLLYYMVECYYYLSGLFRMIGNYELALDAIQRATDVLHEKKYHVETFVLVNAPLYDNQDYFIDTYRCLILTDMNRCEDVVQLFKQAMRKQEEADGGRETRYYKLLRYMLPCLNKLGRYGETAEKLAELWNFEVNDLLQHLVVLNEQQREQYWGQRKQLFESAVPKQALLTMQPQMWEMLYDNALLTKGLLLNTEMEIERVIADDGVPSHIVLYQQLRQKQLLLMNELQIPRASRTIDTDSLQSHIRSQLYELTNALQRDKRGDLVSRLRVSWTDVEHVLGKDDAAVEFITCPMSQDSLLIVALTLRRGYDRPRLTPLCTVSAVKALPVADYYGSTQLYDLIWHPLADELRDIRNVYFSPVGVLHQIGIEYLPGMEQYNMYRLTSTRELLNTRPVSDPLTASLKKGKGQIVLYGGIKYELTTKEREDIASSEKEKWQEYSFCGKPDLPSLREMRGAVSEMPVLEGSRREVANIDSLMRRRHVNVITVMGTSGTETSFKALSGQRKSLIHVSTHGFYQPEQERFDIDDFDKLKSSQDGNHEAQTLEDRSLSRSGLLMTGAADYLFGNVSDIGRDDGILTAREISRLDLRGLDLVVLSACETGLGDISGEGVFGLQRGFKKAGAQTLLVSLWKVEDEATQILMIEFYRGLLSGKTRRSAFLDAQQMLRHADGGRFDRYECWAAFVMIDALQ